MSWNEIVYGIADIFQFCFRIMAKIGNYANVLFIVIGFIALFMWISYMLKASK